MADKTDSLIADLLGAKMTAAEDFEKYKAENKAKFDDAVSLSEQCETNIGEAAARFEQASKMNLDAKFKEYVGLKAQEFKKRAARYKATAAYLKAFIAETDAAKADRLTVAKLDWCA